MAAEIPSTQDIQKVAMLFADAFQKKGVGGSAANVSKINTANTGDSGGLNFGGGAKEALDEHTLAKLKNQLLAKNNKLLKEYHDLQKIVNDDGKLSVKQGNKLKAINRQLGEDAEILGNSFVKMADDFKNKSIDTDGINAFIKKDITKLTDGFVEDMGEAGDDMVDAVQKNSRLIGIAGNKLAEITSSFAIKAVATNTVKNFVQQLNDTMKYGSSILGGASTAVDALKLGVSPSDLLELQSKNKKLIAGMGGAAAFNENLNKISDEQFKHYGNLSESVKGSAQIMTAFSLGGVDAKKAMDTFKNSTIGGSGLTQTFKEIQAATGQTFAEQAAAMEEYVKNDNIKNRLIGASNAQERRAVIERGLATKKMLVGLGLTAEQATRAGEALHGVAGMDPQERLKESYKAQAVLGALGIENAELVGKAMRAGGVENLAPAEQAKAMVAIAEAAQMKAKAQSGEVSGQGLSQFAVLSKGGGALDNMMKAAGDINLADKDKARAEIERNMAAANADNDSMFASGLRTASEISQMVTTGMGTNALLGGITGILMGMTRLMMMKAGRRGAAAGIGEMFFGKKKGKFNAMGKVSSKAGIFSRAGGAISGGARSAAGGIGNMARGAGGMASSAAGGIAKGGSGMLSKAGSFLGKGLKFAKFLGPIAAIGGAVYGAAEGFSQAADIFKGKELTAGMKAASAFGGVVSSLSFGLIEAGSVAKGVHGLFDSPEEEKKAKSIKTKRFHSMNVNKLNEFGRGVRGMSDGGDFSKVGDGERKNGRYKKVGRYRKQVKGMSESDFNEAMAQAGGDREQRQFLIQSRFAGNEPTTKKTGGRNSRIQAPMGAAKSLNITSVQGDRIMKGTRSNAGVTADENEVKEALLTQNALLEKIANNSDKGVTVNEKQLKTSNDMKRNQETAAAEASEYGGNGLAFNSAEF